MSERMSHHGVVVGTDDFPSSRVALQWEAREAAMRHVPLPSERQSSPWARIGLRQ